MKYGIICAMDEELAILKDALQQQTIKMVNGLSFYTGVINNHPVVLVKSGVGKVQAGVTTALLISIFEVDAVINTGSAGGIGEGLQVGDVVVATQTAYHDVDATAFNYEIGQLPGCPARFDASAKLVERIQAAATKNGLNTKTGLIVTGDQFVASSSAIAKIKENFADALCVEMEGAAVGQVAVANNVDYVVIRAMSDVGDEEASVSFGEFIIEAGKKSGQMMLNLLNED